MMDASGSSAQANKTMRGIGSSHSFGLAAGVSGKRLALLGLALIALPAWASSAPPDVPKYSVTFDAQLTHADVRLCLDRAHAQVEFAPDSARAMRFLSAMRRSSTGDLQVVGGSWLARDWAAGECVAYTADLAAIVDQGSDAGKRYGKNLVTDPQQWLVRASAQGASGAEATMELPEGWSISAPWRELSRNGTSIRFKIPDTPQDWSASLVLGEFEQTRIDLPGGAVRVALLNGKGGEQARLAEWLRIEAQAFLGTYGRLPVADVQIWLVSVDSASLAKRYAGMIEPGAVLGGESARGQGNALQLDVDPSRPAQEFVEDWTAIHELSHLLHPYLGDRGSWLSEGLATYYQNVLRARGALLSPEQAWERLASGFQRSEGGPYPQSLEQAAANMGQSPAFQRVYWSGAAYWLGVDVDLRRATRGKITLDTALAAFRGCCLPAYREWKPEEFVAKLDGLAGVHTFTRQYHRFAAMKRFPDWRATLARLGVNGSQDALTFGADAPDACIREAITAARIDVANAPDQRDGSAPQTGVSGIRPHCLPQ